MRLVKRYLPIGVLFAGTACAQPAPQTFCTMLTVPNPGWQLQFSAAYQCPDKILVQAQLTNAGGIQPQVLTQRKLCVAVSDIQADDNTSQVLWQIAGKTWGWGSPGTEQIFVEVLSQPIGCRVLAANAVIDSQ